jgi:F-type H+-transporting ATPase subunit gamma
MPENLQALKGRIRTANNISQIAKTLEMVSAIKIRRAQAMMGTAQPYAEGIRSLAEDILAHAAPSLPLSHPYISGGKSPARLLIAIGPDKGLCGPLLSNLTRKLLDLDDPNLLLITVGKRIERAGARMSKSRLIAAFPLGTGVSQYSLVYDLVRIVNEHILSSRASSLTVLFSRYVSYVSQVPDKVEILPLPKPPKHEHTFPYEIEPNTTAVIEALFPHYLEVMLYWLVVEAYTSEQAARLSAMQNAKNNALDTADFLTLTFNKTRQERITNEILDLANQGIGT